MKPMAPLVVLAAAGCLAPSPPELLGAPRAAGALTQVSFMPNPAGLRMWKYVPADMPENAPLVVALHGCAQQAADFVNAGWNALADRYKFYVLYPEQTATNNALECFNWAGSSTSFVTGQNDPANLERGKGENLSIKSMIDTMKADHSIDASRVFVTGLSAGGAEAVLLLAVWPDVFAAGASFAGIPYDCTTNANEVQSCMHDGITHTAKQWGDLVRQDFPGYGGPWPRIAIWQGTSDSIVSPSVEVEIMKQFTDLHGLLQTATASDTIAGMVARDVYRDASGAPAVEVHRVPGMDHGVPVDAKNGCGQAAQYFVDNGVCAAYWVAADWGIASGAPGGNGGAGGNGNGGAGGNGNGDNGGGRPSAGGCSFAAAPGPHAGAIVLVAFVLAIGAIVRRRARA